MGRRKSLMGAFVNILASRCRFFIKHMDPMRARNRSSPLHPASKFFDSCQKVLMTFLALTKECDTHLDDDEPVKDVIEVGLQNLTEGNKNPLSEYNEAFQNLQVRRRMKPVVSEPSKEKGAAPDPDSIPQLSRTAIPPQQEGFSRFGMGREGMFDAEDDAEETINGFKLLGALEGNEDEPG